MRGVIGLEWQRRQHQRSVLALLGLLTLVSAATAATPAVTLPRPGGSPAAVAESICVEPPAPRAGSAAHREAQRRYWAAFEPALADGVRQQLRRHTGPRGAESRRAAWLRRFLRPPTPGTAL